MIYLQSFIHSSYHNSCCHKFLHLWFRIAVYGLSRGSGLGRLCPNHVGAPAPMVDHYFPPPPPLTHHHRTFRVITLPVLRLHVPFSKYFCFFLFPFPCRFVFYFPFLEIKSKNKGYCLSFVFFFLFCAGGMCVCACIDV